MKYIDFLWALDLLYRYYPRYHANELLILADDIVKWVNNELPSDSSAFIYLKKYFNTPQQAVHALWKEMQILLGPYINLN